MLTGLFIRFCRLRDHHGMYQNGVDKHLEKDLSGIRELCPGSDVRVLL